MATRKGERSRTDLKPLPFSGGVDTEVEPNDYDKARKVVPVKDTRSLPIGARTLSTEMSCPICLDLLSQTMTAKECLHRFCSECITMALQRGNKECPTCRKKLVSKRSLRPDPNFDLLISKVWPDRSIYDNLQTHEMQLRREGSPDDDEIEMVTGEDGIPHPKKKKTGYDADSMMEYFLAQQSRNRQRADEEEFPELNGEQAFLEREAIDNLLDNGSMHYYEDYENDDDVYGDEMEIDESGNLVEVRHREPPQPEPEDTAEDIAGPADDGEGDDDDEEYEPIDSMAALTPEQQEELQADLEELETIEFEHYELDFSDEELPEEGDPTIEEMERNNGLRCTSDTEDDAETEMEKKAATRRIIESIEEGTSDSSASSPLTIEGKPEEVDRDATPPAYAPEPPKKEEPKKEDRPPLIIQAVLKTAPDRPFPEGTLEVEDRLEFTPPKDDDEDPPPGPCSITSLMASPPVDPAVLGAFGLGPTSVIAIAPTFGTGGAIVKEEQATPPPVDVASCSDITIIEEDDDSSDSTSTTYSSSGCTTSTSTLSSTISIEYSDGYDDPEPTPLDMDVSFTEGDIQIPNNPNAFSLLAQGSSSSTHVKPSWTSLTAFSEDLPPHREDPCCSTEEEIDVEGIRPPSSTIPSTERLCHWLANSPSSPQSTDEDMAGAPERRPDDCDVVEPISGSEEIEAELLPACSLMQRDCPEELLIPRYVRAKHDTKMEHLAEFIHQRAMEECQSNQTDFDADPVPTIPKPKHFYVFSRNGGHHVKQIFLHETMSTALCAMTQGDHLIIFFDITGIDLRGEKLSLLADVVPSHFLNLPTV